MILICTMANQIKSSCFIKWLFNTCVSYNSAILSVFGREFQRISAIIHNAWHEAYMSWKNFFKCIHITRLGYISTKFPRPGSDVPSSLKHDMWHSRPRVPILLDFAPFRSIPYFQHGLSVRQSRTQIRLWAYDHASLRFRSRLPDDHLRLIVRG